MTDDYTGQDGLIYCGKCHTRKQARFDILGQTTTVWVPCECMQKENDREKVILEERRKSERIKRLQYGLADEKYLEYTFAADDGRNPKITDTCRKYVDNWKNIKREHIGMILYGDVGTGKTF